MTSSLHYLGQIDTERSTPNWTHMYHKTKEYICFDNKVPGRKYGGSLNIMFQIIMQRGGGWGRLDAYMIILDSYYP